MKGDNPMGYIGSNNGDGDSNSSSSSNGEGGRGGGKGASLSPNAGNVGLMASASRELNGGDSNTTASSSLASIGNITGKISSVFGATLLGGSKYSTFITKGLEGTQHIWTVTSESYLTGLGLRTFGRALGGVSLLWTFNNYENNNIDGVTAGIDGGSTLLGLLGGPYGFALSFGYSIFNAAIPYDHRMEVMSRRFENASKAKNTEEAKRLMGSCFVKGTKILMADKSNKNIEDIEKGDKIMSVNISIMEIEPDLVVSIPNALKKYRIIEAKFSNGVVNRFSPAHPYWVKNKGWSVFDTKEAKTELEFDVNKLEIGDVVLFYDGGKLIETKIITLFDTKEYVEMYNVEFVKKNHTFFANSILVHNKRIN